MHGMIRAYTPGIAAKKGKQDPSSPSTCQTVIVTRERELAKPTMRNLWPVNLTPKAKSLKVISGRERMASL